MTVDLLKQDSLFYSLSSAMRE